MMTATPATVIAALVALVVTHTFAAEEPAFYQCEGKEQKCPDDLKCANGKGGWAQCVNCNETQFILDCPYWHDKVLLQHAEKVCDLECLGQRNNQCNTIDCDEDQGLKCARSSDTWAQCVDCAEAAFQEDCGYWSDALVAAAEGECETKCHSRVRLL